MLVFFVNFFIFGLQLINEIDAKGDVLRGLQVAEGACNIPQQMVGELLEVAKDMETRSYREPLGVVAAICPFSKFHNTEKGKYTH